MEKLEVTSLSSRGQIVIPQEIREDMDLKGGEKFVVVGEEGTIILKKLEMPSFKGFEKLLKKTQSFSREKGLKSKHLREAIKRTRKR